MNEYEKIAQLFKALGDPIRLQIVDMISCDELCACMILIKFNITQPTLSHHMKILCDCGLVNGRKSGKWTYYSLDGDIVMHFQSILDKITSCESQNMDITVYDNQKCEECNNTANNDECCDNCKK